MGLGRDTPEKTEARQEEERLLARFPQPPEQIFEDLKGRHRVIVDGYSEHIVGLTQSITKSVASGGEPELTDCRGLLKAQAEMGRADNHFAHRTNRALIGAEGLTQNALNAAGERHAEAMKKAGLKPDAEAKATNACLNRKGPLFE